MNNEWQWKIPNSSQHILFTDEVISHFEKYKQRKICSREAGGQLFANIADDNVLIDYVSGPFCTDVRRLYSYRTDPIKAQEVIDKEFNNGRIYVGEWHTHRESVPKPSKSDKDTISDTLKYSKHPFEGIILVIQGLDDLPEGIGVFIQYKNSFLPLEREKI